MKLHLNRGVVSSSHLPPQFESIGSPDHLTSPSLGCSLLLKVPAGSSAELTLRKLKLLRPHSRHELCHEDSQLQLATSTTWDPHQMTDVENINSWHQSSWSTSVEVHRWQVARTFCGKIQDYAKNLRTWRTFDPWVLIRFRSSQRVRHHLHTSNGASSSFFAIKFNIVGPCSNVLLTEKSKTIELSYSDLMTSVSECTFRIHVAYGFSIRLSIRLLFEDGKTLNEGDQKEQNEIVHDKSFENALLLQSGKCPVAVQVEDITGHQVQCLNDRHMTASFSSVGNVFKFQAMVLPINQGNPLFPVCHSIKFSLHIFH